MTGFVQTEVIARRWQEAQIVNSTLRPSAESPLGEYRLRLLGLKILRLNGWNIVIVGVVVDNDGDVDESNSPEWIENGLQEVADVEGKPSEEEDEADAALEQSFKMSQIRQIYLCKISGGLG